LTAALGKVLREPVPTRLVIVPGNSRDGKSREIVKNLDLSGKSQDFPENLQAFPGFSAFISLPVSWEHLTGKYGHTRPDH
jgi:hypothetical protein